MPMALALPQMCEILLKGQQFS